jgi:hypothetical protein
MIHNELYLIYLKQFHEGGYFHQGEATYLSLCRVREAFVSPLFMLLPG